MFQISSSIYDVFELVLASYLHLVLDDVYKGPKLSKAMTEKGFELFLHNGPNNYAFNFLFVLLLVIYGLVFLKNSYKKDLILANSSNNSKINFALLTNIIAIYIKFTMVYVQYSNF